MLTWGAVGAITSKETYTGDVRGIPPFAKCAKDGAPFVLLVPTRSKAADDDIGQEPGPRRIATRRFGAFASADS